MPPKENIMNTKYFNLFWAILATIVVTYELTFGQSTSISFYGKQFGMWVLVIVWSLVGLRNYYLFYTKYSTITKE
jgi:hypothetical protein